ncbi:unnamed protein product [Rotaria sp. Silwood1]|nr:unnamed protein product [Rotaria sp. Silwood1]CAF1487062.1 unnamed protein product [Rotaria sp. Silwood1]
MAMISTNQYHMSSFDFDDLFLFSDDFYHQNEYEQFCTLHDDLIEDNTSLSKNNQYQQQTLLHNNSIKESNLECRVCGASAQGYNFDQITCESCKAFFRRNALRDMSQLKCRFSGSCIINIFTRRQCTYCRLKKCFDIHMRKDWIRTDEEKKSRQLIKLVKEQKKTNILTNDQLSLINFPIVIRKKKRLIKKSTNQEFITNSIYEISFFDLNHNLHNNDRILINNINNAYQLVVDKIDYSCINKYTSLTPLSQFMHNESIMHESLINFFKYIPEFKQLDKNDQIILIKSNLINIIHLHHLIMRNFQDCPNIGNHMSKWINEDFHNRMSRTHRYLFRFMNYPLLLKLTLIIFIFSINLSASSDINQFYEYNNSRILFEYQNYYINILWRYLNCLFDEKEVIQSIQIIVTQILRYQLLMVTMKNSVQQSSDCDQFHSLMKSIFGLS